MIYTVQEFCEYVDSDLNAFIDEVAGISRKVSDEEKKAYAGSYPAVANMLNHAVRKNPSVAKAHISTSQLLLEYKLPAASAWCDLVLLGDRHDGKHQVIIIELKNYLKKSLDEPAAFEGGMIHNGELIKHPADQVKGYTEYCRRFHSAVHQYNADVDGCVYFTQPIALEPYRQKPNDELTVDYKLFNTESADELSSFVAEKIEKGNQEFAVEFINGYYQQDRNILKQVGESFLTYADAKPFVLLEEQRLGFNQIMNIVRQRVSDSQKEVFIVQGPPGSGKSAVAANLWAQAAVEFPSETRKRNNVVFVTTNKSQENNWREIFSAYGSHMNASDFIISANQFHPGLTLTSVANVLVPAFTSRPDASDYISTIDKKGKVSLRFDKFRDYTKYMIDNGFAKGYRTNNHFLCIVDEAHALWNPTAPTYAATGQGWAHQAGPQAWHIINQSQISVFLMDSKQSFREYETTTEEDIKAWAEELGANVTVISLNDLQFRCAGSKEYIDWIEGVFSTHPIRNASKWRKLFGLKVVDFPSELEDYLRPIIDSGNPSCRLLSSYTEKWASSGLDAAHKADKPFDFDLEDKNGQRWQRYWNSGNVAFVQASQGEMKLDPLSEVGCPYIIRGFDIDHIGIIMMDDIVIRNGEWYINFPKVQETAIKSLRSKALKEQQKLQGKRTLKAEQVGLVKAFDPDAPVTTQLFLAVAKGYRILLSRAIKSAAIYIKDEETRNYVRSLLK